MFPVGNTGGWRGTWDTGRLPDGPCLITVRVENEAKESAQDTIVALVSHAGTCAVSTRHWPGDDANAIGAYPEKGLLGTQIGPNKNYRRW